MAKVKGERIATNLLGRIVTSEDANNPNPAKSARAGWPLYWTKPPASTADERLEPWRIQGRAEVVAVFVHEGDVRLLLHNHFGEHPLLDRPAREWRLV